MSKALLDKQRRSQVNLHAMSIPNRITPTHQRVCRYFIACLLPLCVTTVNAMDLAAQGLMLLEQGRQVEAHTLFAQAAQRGDPIGQYGLGVLYDQGLGVTRDSKKSAQWFGKAARQGNAAAQFNLGNAYLNGRGVSRDTARTEYWWRQAAAQGYAKAQYNLGSLLISDGKTADILEEGIAWYRAAAEQGLAMARQKLHEIDEPVAFFKTTLDPQREPARSEARILTANPKRFLIQLFSGKQAGSAERFISQYDLSRFALPFRFKGRDGTWTGVVYGDYASREEAQQAIDSFKPALRELNPWIRASKDVQNLLREVRK
jgi:TPR repeat protein